MAKAKPQKSEIRFSLHDKQFQAFDSRASFVFFGGAKGGGKSHLARVASIQAFLTIPGLSVYIFRKHYADLLSNHMTGPTSFRALLAPLEKQGIVKINETEIHNLVNGAAIHLRHLQHEKDVDKYQGVELHFLILEEATQFSEYATRVLLSCSRIPDAIRSKLTPEDLTRWPRILATSNPGGLSHNFYKTRFVDRGEGVFRMSEEDGGRFAEFIPAFVRDNPSINPQEYEQTLKGLGRPELVQAYLYGDWSVQLGQFFPECDDSRHLLPDISLPSHWYTFRSFDWGGLSPAAVLWWKVSDGTVPGIPRGALVCYREWYIASEMDRSKGLALSNDQMAYGILNRTHKSETIDATVSDSLPFQARGGRTIAEDFAAVGVPLKMGDVSPGSRVQGWQQLRSRLIGSDGKPMIYFFKSCKETWRCLKQLQTDSRNPEDCDSDGEDHAPDAVSLACKARPWVREAPKPPPTGIDPRLPGGMSLIDSHIRKVRRESYERRI